MAFFPPGYRITTSSGDPINGAKVYFYAAGTTDPVTVYQDSGFTTPHTSPMVCTAGIVPAYYGPLVEHKVVVTTDADVTIGTWDNIEVDTSGGGGTGGGGGVVNLLRNTGFRFNSVLGDLTTGTVNAVLYSPYNFADGWTITSDSNSDIKFGRTAPGGLATLPPGIRYELSFDVSASAGPSNEHYVRQRIPWVGTAAGQTVTVSLYLKGSQSTAVSAVGFIQHFDGSSPVTTEESWSPTVTSTYDRYETTVTLPSIAGKTIGGGNYLEFYIKLPSGAVSSSRGVDIAAIQVEIAPTATPYQDGMAWNELAVQNSFSGRKNALANGCFRIAQRGASFTAATSTVNNDDTYTLDRWVLLSDGNDIVDVSQETSFVPYGAFRSLKLDVETASKKFGIVQILSASDSAQFINAVATLSFKCFLGSNTTLETLRYAIISWQGTADAVTSDVVSAWGGAGTNPTLAANWTYETTPASFIASDKYWTQPPPAIGLIDTASTSNIAVFIWVDDVDATVGDILYIGDVQLERGNVATSFDRRSLTEERNLCLGFFERLGGSATNEPLLNGKAISASGVRGTLLYAKKRSVPAITSSAESNFRIDTSGVPTGISFANIGLDRCRVSLSGLSALTAQDAYYVETVSTSGVIDISSEL